MLGTGVVFRRAPLAGTSLLVASTAIFAAATVTYPRIGEERTAMDVVGVLHKSSFIDTLTIELGGPDGWVSVAPFAFRCLGRPRRRRLYQPPSSVSRSQVVVAAAAVVAWGLLVLTAPTLMAIVGGSPRRCRSQPRASTAARGAGRTLDYLLERPRTVLATLAGLQIAGDDRARPSRRAQRLGLLPGRRPDLVHDHGLAARQAGAARRPRSSYLWPLVQAPITWLHGADVRGGAPGARRPERPRPRADRPPVRLRDRRTASAGGCSATGLPSSG